MGLFFNNPFAFPPYSVIHKCLQKIEVEEINRVTMLLPNWPSQPWFPIMLRLLIAHPIYIPQVLLLLPWDPLTQSSLSHGTAFLLVQLSGKSSNIMDYHRSLQNSSHVHGEVKLKRITPRTLTSGFTFVTSGKLIPLIHHMKRSSLS